MALSSLIDGQTIKIDNHNIGTLYQWDEAIHLHKRMNSDKYRGAEVIIPIAIDGKLEFKGIDGRSRDDLHIKNEIKKAFSNPTIRTRFVKSLINNLSDLFSSSKISKEEWYELFVTVAERIAVYFGLKTKVKEQIGIDILRFSRENKLDFFIKANRKEKTIILGTDITLIGNFDK